MPFWTVEDAGPYKEKSNFLMRTTLLIDLFFYVKIMTNATNTPTTTANEVSLE